MGPTLEIQTLDKDQVLGWSWLISPYKWNFQTKAEEDSELLQFDGTAILARCEQEPKFGYELLKKFAALMSVGLNAARQKMMEPKIKASSSSDTFESKGRYSSDEYQSAGPAEVIGAPDSGFLEISQGRNHLAQRPKLRM